MYWSITIANVKYELQLHDDLRRCDWISVTHSVAPSGTKSDLADASAPTLASSSEDGSSVDPATPAPYRIKWLADQRILLIDLGGGLTRQIIVKNQEVTRTEGEATRNCRLNWRAGSRTFHTSAMVHPNVPGQRHRTSLQVAGVTIIRSKMTGKILKIPVVTGQHVEIGDTLAVIEAMKMENRITAPAAGVVEKINVEAQSSVSAGQEIFRLNAADTSSSKKARNDQP